MQNVLVIGGAGFIGSHLVDVLIQEPINVFVYDTDPGREQIAASMGFSIFKTGNSDFNQFDLAFNASASGDALQLCIDTTLPESKIIEVSWYGLSTVNIRLGGSFHINQKQIIASQVSNIPVIKQGHFNYKRRKELVFDLLQNPIFDQLPFQLVSLDKLPEILSQLRNHEYKHFATIVKY